MGVIYAKYPPKYRDVSAQTRSTQIRGAVLSITYLMLSHPWVATFIARALVPLFNPPLGACIYTLPL